MAGHDPAVGGRVPVNLDHQIPITVSHVPADIGTPRTAQLDLSLGGVPVVRSTAVPFVRGSSGFETTMDASAGRYIVGGKLAASLKLSGPRGTVTDDFGVQAGRSPFATFGGVVGIVLLLFVVAYTESLLRSLRRGRRRDNRTASIVGLVVVGLVGGLAAILWGWMLRSPRPRSWPSSCLRCWARSPVCWRGWPVEQVGERTRARRQSNRLVLVARRTACPPPNLPRCGRA